MAFVMKSIAVLAQWGAAAAFSPGDCAFVGIYGDKDDFAVLLLEDVNGESLSLTDANFKDRDLKVDQWQWAEAKAHVKDAQKGTILRKWDFDTNSQNAFAAPVSLTVIKGSPGMTESPSVLCGINMAQPQNRQLSTSNGLELVEAETAEYVGPKFGTKEDLFQSMTDPSNWGRQSRQLSSFTVASGNTTTMPTSTTEDDDDDDDESTTEEQVTSTEEQVTSTEDHDDHDDHDDNGTGPTDGGAPRLCAVGGGFAALALLTQ